MSWSSNNGDIKPDIDDNWGCVDPSELFSGVGKTQPLRFLVDQLVKSDGDRSRAAYNNGMQANNPWRSSPAEASSVNGSNHGQQSSSFTNRKSAPKILKQKRGLVERIPSLKRVTFEVEKFVTDQLQAGSEKNSAAARMAISLGALPARSKSVNYKQLKADRQQKSNCTTPDIGADFLRSLGAGSKKVKKKASNSKNTGKKMNKRQLKKVKKSGRK
uniref:Uncharacterized protein n=1 Tax=Ditylenchus dipsaci TaxID=166011 RepID=A0A915ELU9_9BILA